LKHSLALLLPLLLTAQKPETGDAQKRVELNLLGKEDTTKGESRRNENIQFNLVDNNALKELNVRLGATATLIEEFRADRGYYGAEFGIAVPGPLALAPQRRAGWHGNAFANHQNSVFAARAFFQVGDVKPARENRYGLQTGWSPWRKGFLSLQGSQEKLRGQVNGNVLVPYANERTALATDPAVRAVVQRYLDAFGPELPNRGNGTRQLNTNAPQRIDSNDGGLRLEQEVTAKDRLFANYQFTGQTVDAFQLIAGQNPDTTTRSHRARLTWSHGGKLQLSSGFDRIGSVLVPEPNAVGPMVSTAGLTTLGPLAAIPIDRAQNIFRQEAQYSSVFGRHTVSFGGGLTRRQFNGKETDSHRGFLSFSNDFGRLGIENMRLGTPSQYLVAVGDIHRGFRQTMGVLYAQDSWKVSSDLTLQWGLRWELAGRPYEEHRLNEIPYNADWNNLAPRMGLAYRLPRNGGVIRAAAGVHFGEIMPVSYSQVRFSPPLSVKLVILAPNLLNPLVSTGVAPKGNLYLIDRELATPYHYQYNFSWERGLGAGWRLQAGYVGSRAHKLAIMWYTNRAHPTAGIPLTTATINERRPNLDLADVRIMLNGSRGYFDAGRLTVVAPRVKRFTVDAAYWFSKAMDLGADYTNTAYDADSRLSRSQSEYDTHKDRKARSQFDQPHAFLARVSYDLPQGWTVSTVALLKQGTPFNLTTLDGPGFGNVDGNGGDRPNLLDPTILGRSYGNPDTSVERLPRGAFRYIATGAEAGNLGANVFRKGAIRNVNAALAKSWQLPHEMKLLLRAESINLLNTPQFAEPGSMLGTPEFGFITNTLNDGRTFRFNLGLQW
jgi:hypothetical protein